MLEVTLAAADVEAVLAQTQPQILALIAVVAREMLRESGGGGGFVAIRALAARPPRHDLLRLVFVLVVVVVVVVLFVFFFFVGSIVVLIAAAAIAVLEPRADLALPPLLESDEARSVEVFDVDIADENDVRAPARADAVRSRCRR